MAGSKILASILEKFKPQPFVNRNLDRPSTPPIYEKLREACALHLQKLKTKDSRLITIENSNDFKVNYDAKEIIYHLPKGKNLKVSVIPTGKYCLMKKTWQWMWIDEYGNIDMESPLLKIRNQATYNLGSELMFFRYDYQIELLKKVEWYASMEDADSMVSIANKILDGKGVIKLAEAENIYYLVIESITEL